MKPTTIHNINTGLILLSCLVAFFIPFELFLFSYGILGPLHYLTEIGWLHKKNYFTRGKYDFVFLALSCSLLVYWNYNPPKDFGIAADLIVLSFLSCIAFVFIKDWLYRLAVIGSAMLFVSVLNNAPHYINWVAIFVPTLVHVFIFTWAFMVFGVLKDRSVQGVMSIAALIVCSILIFAIQPAGFDYQVSEYTKNSYRQFGPLNYMMINVFNMDKLTDVKQIFTTNAGFVTMRFIAFAYTYHYLNWFSKTSVIKWHMVPRKTLVATVLAWLACIGLNVYDYNLGLNVLLFLSFLHVFLEFPLNVVSFAGIGNALLSMRKVR